MAKATLSSTALKNTNAYELGVVHIFMARKINNFRRKALKGYGLTSAQWFILGVVDSRSKEGGIRVTDLANILDVKTTYVTAALNQLRDKNLVSTRVDSLDGRAKLLIATKEGSNLTARINQSINRSAQSLLNDSIIGDSLEEYIRLLKKIAKRRFLNTHR